jgi:hypothetical protein
MSLQLKTLTQINPGACTHYRAEFLMDGVAETVDVSLYDLESFFKSFPGGYKRALLLALMHYQIENSVPVPKLPEKVRIKGG